MSTSENSLGTTKRKAYTTMGGIAVLLAVSLLLAGLLGMAMRAGPLTEKPEPFYILLAGVGSALIANALFSLAKLVENDDE